MDAFVDVRTETGDSSLILAIKNKNQVLIMSVLQEIWNANKSGNNALIFGRIIYSKFDGYGHTILNALISLKLFHVLEYLIRQHHVEGFLLPQDSMQITKLISIVFN